MLATKQVPEFHLLEAVALHQLSHENFERVCRVELHIREVSYAL